MDCVKCEKDMTKVDDGKSYDLIVIGAGPGGYEAAYEGSKEYGMKVALIERDSLGGTCLNRGCIPTKTMLHTAVLCKEVKNKGEFFGIKGGESLSIDMSKLWEYKGKVVTQLQSGIKSLMKAGKIDVYNGTGTIIGTGQVSVSQFDEESNETVTTIIGKNILIATGSVPSVPPIPGADNAGVMTSDDILDNQEPIESLIIIGGGVIGCEIGYLYNAMGTKVTIIEAMDRLLSTMDKELGQSLKMQFKKEGIEVLTKASVKELSKAESGLICTLEDKEIEAEKVLIATGRKADITGLIGPDSLPEIRNLQLDRGKIAVDENFQTSVKGIYAIGDVIGGIQLAHVATAEGRCAVAAMNGRERPVDLSLIPSCIYTEPEIATVGLTNEEAMAKCIEAATQKYSMGANGKSTVEMAERGFIKVIYEKDTDKILGAAMLCQRATDMISQFTSAIETGLTLKEMSKIVFPHPTFSEGIGEAVKKR